MASLFLFSSSILDLPSDSATRTLGLWLFFCTTQSIFPGLSLTVRCGLLARLVKAVPSQRRGDRPSEEEGVEAPGPSWSVGLRVQLCISQRALQGEAWSGSGSEPEGREPKHSWTLREAGPRLRQGHSPPCPLQRPEPRAHMGLQAETFHPLGTPTFRLIQHSGFTKNYLEEHDYSLGWFWIKTKYKCWSKTNPWS